MAQRSVRDGLGVGIQENWRPDTTEYLMLRHISQMRDFDRYRPFFEKLAKGSLDMPAFLRQLAPELLLGLLGTLNDPDVSEKLKTNIRQDLLDRAGHGKIAKAINLSGTLDPKTSRRELMNIIMTKAKAAGVVIERKDDENVMDVAPADSKLPNNAATAADCDEVRGEVDEFASNDPSNKGGRV
jgi:hypothetical protein